MKTPLLLALAVAVATVGCTTRAVEHHHSAAHPAASVIALPTGSIPEGIAIRDSHAFVTSLADGTVYRLDLLTGTHEVFGAPTGNTSVGILADPYQRLFVAEGRSGSVRVLDAHSGKALASYQLATDEPRFINDFTRLGNAIYATDSFAPALYRLPLGEDGALPQQADIERLPLRGIAYRDGFNANGIAPTPDGKALLVVQTNTGLLYRVDPASGAATRVDIGDTDLKGGDGLLLEDHTLYVVRNIPNTLTVLEVDAAGTRARLKAELKDPGFDSPTTVARFRDRLYLPNARFTHAAPATAEFNVISVGYLP